MRKTPEDMAAAMRKEYQRRIKPKKIFAILSRTCIKCANEIKFESIYEIEVPYQFLFRDQGQYYCGCTQCFTDRNDFFNHMNTNYLDESLWIFKSLPENVSLMEWAVISGIMTKEQASSHSYKELLKKYISQTR